MRQLQNRDSDHKHRPPAPTALICVHLCSSVVNYTALEPATDKDENPKLSAPQCRPITPDPSWIPRLRFASRGMTPVGCPGADPVCGPRRGRTRGSPVQNPSAPNQAPTQGRINEATPNCRRLRVRPDPPHPPRSFPAQADIQRPPTQHSGRGHGSTLGTSVFICG